MGRITQLDPLVTISSGHYVAVDVDNGTDDATYRFDLGAALEAEKTLGEHYDAQSGRYLDLDRWLARQRDGLVYGVRIPKYSATTSPTCVKTGANAGLSVTPSTATVAGDDDYADRFPFMHWCVNGGADSDGSPFVTAFRVQDTSFSLTGANGNVWELAPVLYWRFAEYDEYFQLDVSDTWLAGFKPQPGALLPDGTLRPFMLYAKYAGCTYGGKLASVSGQKARNRDVSHDSLITLAAAVGAGYSGKSIADDWYVKTMFLMKYATKHSQSVFAGCSDYTGQAHPSVAETGASRVIVSNADAAKFEVGSAVMLGDQATASTDRGSAYCYNVFDGLTILRKEAYDSDNTALVIDATTTFDTGTAYLLSTAPWPTGALDSVLGSDGTITAAGRTNSREPFLLQGIECMVGFYEILSGVIINAAEADGELVCELHVAYDTADDATSLTSDFVDTGVSLPASTAAGWLYTCDISDAGGLLVGTGQGASTSTGTGDGCYQNVATSKGTREFLGLGYLDNWGVAGLLCVRSNYGLGGAWWLIGSRLSATGRSGVN